MFRIKSTFCRVFSSFTTCSLIAIATLGLASTSAILNYSANAEAYEYDGVGIEAAEDDLRPPLSGQDEATELTPEAQKPATATTSTPASAPVPVAAPAPQPPQGCYQPRPFIYIPSVGMCMNIVTVGWDGAAAAAPNNTYQAGWFSDSAPLGSTGGASFVDGHSPGLFSAIKGVSYGTIITIGLADGRDVNYQVTGTQIVALGSVDMYSILTTPGLNLMTCHGVNDSQRFIVYSSRV